MHCWLKKMDACGIERKYRRTCVTSDRLDWINHASHRYVSWVSVEGDLLLGIPDRPGEEKFTSTLATIAKSLDALLSPHLHFRLG